MSKSIDSRLELSGSLDEAALADVSAYVGQPMRIELWGTEASRDNIHRYALGIGDINPISHDREVGRRSALGTMVAPPTFLYSIFDAEVAPGAGALMALHRGAHWYFHDRVRLGDQLDAAAKVKDARLVEGRNGRRQLVQIGESAYYRRNTPRENALLATVDQEVVRMPKKGDSEGSLSFEPREAYRYSVEELEAIQRDVMAVQVRGATPRYWEEVMAGESIGRVVKGPYSRTTMICYYAGAIGSAAYRAHDVWWRNRYLALHNPEALSNTFDAAMFAGTGVTSGGHHDSGTAHDMGMPGMYDNGNQRVGVTATTVTNWMGDLAFMQELDVHIRRPVILGDTIWIEGWIDEKLGTIDGPWAVEGIHYRQVRVRVEGRNQLGDQVISGSSMVALPRK